MFNPCPETNAILIRAVNPLGLEMDTDKDASNSQDSGMGFLPDPVQCAPSTSSAVKFPAESSSVSSAGEGDVLCDGAKYPDSWIFVCNTDRSKIAVLIPDAHVTHFWGHDGFIYIKFPAVHHATGTLVYVVGPAVNSCVASNPEGHARVDAL